MNTNHLVNEKSPYLLQHAHNPVDWYPWGEEAFQKAQREDKPIFLSVGYSTCHWCHVMERESFENEHIAEILNAHFVPIKADREERPDVDRIYMTFVQASTGSGGWPMSVFLTPSLKPFFGGTYFPPDNRYGRPGFQSLLESLAHAWTKERGEIEESGSAVMDQLAGYASLGESRTGQALSDKTLLDSAYHHFRRTFDSANGGFGDAPKFPRPVVLSFLERYHHRTKNAEALEMVLSTLRHMAEGGINDQLGGGFHRYSVDALWFVPHFEKMLYDQAQLAVAYLEAFQVSADPFYAGVARNTLDYVLRDMSAPEGGFYSAEDADSAPDAAHPEDKREGAFYVWTRQEIGDILGEPAASILGFRYGVDADSNVRSDPHGEFGGQNILFVRRTLEETAREFHLAPDTTRGILDKSIGKLFEARLSRPRPHRDDKILTAWNALMISAFAKGAQVLDEPGYAGAARRAIDFLFVRLYDPATGTLLRRYRDGDAAIPGFLDDYAFLIAAALDMYETVFDLAYLDHAIHLADRMLERFEDREGGGFFSTAEGDAHLLLRLKEDYDGAEPSGNAIAALNLLRLAQITGREDYSRAARRTLEAFGSRIATQAPALPQMLVSLNYSQLPGRQIVIAGDPGLARTQALLRAARAKFLPSGVVFLAGSAEASEHLARYQPALGGMTPVSGEPAAYVCQNFTCQLPVTEPSELEALLSA